jgi:hypothetical protein
MTKLSLNASASLKLAEPLSVTGSSWALTLREASIATMRPRIKPTVSVRRENIPVSCYLALKSHAQGSALKTPLPSYQQKRLNANHLATRRQIWAH